MLSKDEIEQQSDQILLREAELKKSNMKPVSRIYQSKLLDGFDRNEQRRIVKQSIKVGDQRFFRSGLPSLVALGTLFGSMYYLGDSAVGLNLNLSQLPTILISLSLFLTILISLSLYFIRTLVVRHEIQKEIGLLKRQAYLDLQVKIALAACRTYSHQQYTDLSQDNV